MDATSPVVPHMPGLSPLRHGYLRVAILMSARLKWS